MNETGGKKQILVVDDDAIQLSTVGAILNVEYDVTTVSSGKAALEYLSGGFVPDLVLLDVLMPEMNGFEIYDKIRAIDSMGDVPVVFLTSLSAAEESRKALRKGAADYHQAIHYRKLQEQDQKRNQNVRVQKTGRQRFRHMTA